MAMADTQILGNPEMLVHLRADITEAKLIYMYAFKVQEQFFSELFSGFIDQNPLYVVANHSEERVLRSLSREFPHLHAYTWAENRLFHSKIYLFPQKKIAYIGSHNLTKYAFTSGINHSVRIEGGYQVDKLIVEFVKRQKVARELTGYSPSELIA